MAFDARLCRKVFALFAGVLAEWQCAQARAEGIARPHAGCIMQIQRQTDAAQLFPHAHLIAPDGVFHETGDGDVRFHRIRLPKPADIVDLVLEVETRVRRLLDRGDDHEPPEPAPLLLQCAGLDPVAAARVPRAGPQPPNAVPKAKRLCARTEAGFDLHAAVRIAARDGAALERLARYIARPPIPYDRVHLLPDGRVELELKRARANGARALVFEPVVFIARVASRPTLASPSRRALLRSPLAALLPPPRSHTLRFHGVFASRHALRARVVPAPPNPKRSRRPTAPKRPARMGWAHLLARVWKIDLLACPRPGCGGRLRFVAALRPRGPSPLCSPQ